jgi:hypothetical protein
LDHDPGEVLITQSLDDRALDKLSEDGTVLLLCSERISEEYGAEVEIGFSSIFWNTAWTRGQAPHTLGILCDPQHPLYSEFPTGYHSNWQWWDPVTHSRAMILDQLPKDLAPLIQPIDTWFENRRLGLLFEANVAGGRLMVCSIELQKDMDQRPVSRQLLGSILNYMNSDQFDPAVTLTPDLVRMIMRD